MGLLVLLQGQNYLLFLRIGERRYDFTVLDFVSYWREVVSFAFQTLYPWENRPYICLLDISLGSVVGKLLEMLDQKDRDEIGTDNILDLF
jgi:hypothetical protein